MFAGDRALLRHLDHEAVAPTLPHQLHLADGGTEAFGMLGPAVAGRCEIPTRKHPHRRQRLVAAERQKVGDEVVAQVGRQRFVVGDADIGPFGIVAITMRIEQHERGVPGTVCRHHHAEETDQGDEGAVGLVAQIHAGVFADPFHGAGVDERAGHDRLLCGFAGKLCRRWRRSIEDYPVASGVRRLTSCPSRIAASRPR